MEKEIKDWTYEDFKERYDDLSEDTKKHIKNADVFLHDTEQLECFVKLTTLYEQSIRLFDKKNNN